MPVSLPRYPTAGRRHGQFAHEVRQVSEGASHAFGFDAGGFGGTRRYQRRHGFQIEGGSSGARFGVISQLADALGADPAELFTPNLPDGQLQRATLNEITTHLASLSESELLWLRNLIEAALRPKK